ncbi:hypothetical protein KA005_54325, partial [bacterium]|nr:hypothetical protein [bacterium]
MSRKTKDDPTGLRSNRNRGTRTLVSRLRSAQRQVKALFRAIPRERTQKTVIINAVTAVYKYQITPREQELLNDQIRFILNDELLESQDIMPR